MTVDLIGHPFAPIGVGECLRAAARALRQAGVEHRIVSAYDLHYGDPALEAEFAPRLETVASGEIQVFFINGDEVEPVLARLGSRVRSHSYKIIQPMWELSGYPEPWARQLERFDEIWAASAFIRDAIAPAVNRPVLVMPTPVGIPGAPIYGRRHFGLPESSYAFLFAFDLRSYAARKNPEGALEAFGRVVEARPRADFALVLKVGGTQADPSAFAALRAQISRLSPGASRRVHLVEGDLTASEVSSLLWSCDAFLSLHRAEGFGRLLAEAMLLEKPVIATAYSGNIDFTTPETTLLVPAMAVPVPKGAYPFAEGQSWAEPDTAAAVCHMLRLIDDPEYGRVIGRVASRHVRVHLGYRARGLSYSQRFQEIGAAGEPAPRGAPGLRGSRQTE